MKRRFMAYVGAIWLAIAVAVPATALAQDPILFVHGWSESASLWNTMIGRFEKDGYPSSYLSAYTYNTSQSNKIDAGKRSRQPRRKPAQSDRGQQGRHHLALDGQPQHPLVHQVRRR